MTTSESVETLILRIVKKHKSIAKQTIVAYFNDDNDPWQVSEDVLEALIDSGRLMFSGVFVRLPRTRS